MAKRGLLLLLLAYGVLNALLYAGLLPLWDGFDEPFHYAYVSRLWREGRFQTLGRATLSEEIRESMELAPASYLVKRNIPEVISFDEYFGRSQSERVELRRRLEQLDPARAAMPAGGLNYEAQQAPLAYAVLAPFDAWWRHTPLVWRILRLRLLCGIASALATGLLAFRLGGQLGLGERWRLTAVYLVFSSQMFYATTAHVANDWLAVPLFTAVVVTAIAVYTEPTPARAGLFFTALAAGLLTKAYFLALAPLAAIPLLLWWKQKLPWRRLALAGMPPLAIAAAWYARNLALYHDLSGIQQTVGGNPAGMLAAALHMPWAKSLRVTAATGLWFGNSSATVFHSRTIDAMLALLLAAGLLYAITAARRPWPPAEWIPIAAIACFSAGLAYSAVLHFRTTNAGMISPGAWYSQPLFPPGLCLLMFGLQRGGRIGEILRVAMLAVWAYVISATYAAKLIPLYAGYPSSAIRAAELLRWYSHSWRQADRTLATVALMPSGVIWLLAGMVAIAAIGFAITLSLAPANFPLTRASISTN